MTIREERTWMFYVEAFYPLNSSDRKGSGGSGRRTKTKDEDGELQVNLRIQLVSGREIV